MTLDQLADEMGQSDAEILVSKPCLFVANHLHAVEASEAQFEIYFLGTVSESMHYVLVNDC